MDGRDVRRALVTGASRGIGEAVARALAAEGMDVVLNCRENIERCRSVAGEIGGRAFAADVADPAAVGTMLTAVGDVDVLVCNAGIALQKLITDTTSSEWRRIFAVNVEGTFNVISGALPHMIHQHWGRIVVISSMWGIRGASCEVAYSASKAALIGLTKALAKEVGPSGVTVNCVCPGVIDTDMNANLDPDTLSTLADDTPLCRLGAPAEVADTVAFLCSDRAAFVTGQIISVDGGFAV